MKSSILTVPMPATLKQQVRKAAKAADITMAAYVRNVLVAETTRQFDSDCERVEHHINVHG